MRQLYFKLPLTQPRFHWKFSDTEAFLRGRLTLRIIRDGASESIVVFDQGVISEGWRSIRSDQGPPGGIYFGFISSASYMTTARDSLEIELVATEDLWGIGRRISAVLPAGTYRSTGAYSGLTGSPSDLWLPLVATTTKIPLEQLETMPETQALVERLREMTDDLEYQAFMGCWRQAWPLEPRGPGWLSPEEVAESKASEMQGEAQLAKMKGLLAEQLALLGEQKVTLPGLGNLGTIMMDLGTDGKPCR